MNKSLKSGEDNLILMGRVLRPHGLKGLLQVRSYAESASSFLAAGRLFLRASGGEEEVYPILSAKPHRGGVLLELEGLSALQEAEVWKGAEIWIDRDALSKEEDEYFWFELLGLKVMLPSGERLGVLQQVIPTAGGDIYRVEGGGREFFIPAVEDMIREIDLQAGTMTIEPVQGLVDPHEV